MFSVYYKFKSQKKPNKINFDGAGITVFDLKREILFANKLDTTANSFDLQLSNPDTGEVFSDDSEILPRSASVIVQRLPSLKQNDRDTAARYVNGNLAVSAKNASRQENFKRMTTPGAPIGFMPNMAAPSGGAEDEMMQAIFQTQGEQWKRTQEEMADKAPVYFNKNSGPDANKPPPPPQYICHRCGQPGHWISQCPSLVDPNWEIKKVKRTTGIPRSMLRAVEKPTKDDNGSHFMTADGEYVELVADEKSWQEFQNKQKIVKEKQMRAVPEHLQDPITGELMVDPKTTPCCRKTYSDASIQTALINNEFECPNCHKEDLFIDKLVPNEELAAELAEFNGPQEETPQQNLEEFKESQPRKWIRKSSTSTYSESVSSRSSMASVGNDDDDESDEYNIGSPGGSDMSAGDEPVEPPRRAPQPASQGAQQGMPFFPFMPQFIPNQ